MPAQRVPTAKLKLRGAFKRNPKRAAARAHEPKARPLNGRPPKGLKPKEVEAWNDLIADAPAGVLTSADRCILELTAALLAKRRTGALNGFLAQQLRACLASLGMTPADRSKVSAPGGNQPPKSPWDGLTDGAGAN